MEKSSNSNLKNNIISFGVSIAIVAVIVTAVWLLLGNFVFSRYIAEEKMAYEVSSWDQPVTISVKYVAKEKGKEPIYTVDCFYGEKKIPESIFDAYIGEGNNTVTMHFEEIEIYISNSALKHDFEASHYYAVTRYSMPWEDPAPAFTDEEVEKAKKLILAAKFVGKDVDWSDMSSNDSSYKFGKGWCTVNCLEKGATKFVN